MTYLFDVTGLAENGECKYHSLGRYTALASACKRLAASIHTNMVGSGFGAGSHAVIASA